MNKPTPHSFRRVAGFSPRGESNAFLITRANKFAHATQVPLCATQSRDREVAEICCSASNTLVHSRSLGLLVSTLVLLTGCHGGMRAQPDRPRRETPVRAMWVTRWDYKTPADIAHVMENCRRSGINTVLFQVRGNGTAFYRSRLEPWADELGGRDPGFDPLAVACREAHRRGLALHAWVNVIPGWRGNKPPKNPRQLYNRRPQWFWHDASGHRQPLGWYCSINACYPEVRRYLTDVMKEIVTGYPVDGLHMDYIRFPNEHSKAYPPGVAVPDYPRDPRTLAMFKKVTGRTPDESPRQWNQWRTEQITQLVRDIRTMMKRERPEAMLSAAVGADPVKALRHHFQDVGQWIDQRLVDTVYPMNYSNNRAIFAARLAHWSKLRDRVRVVHGVMCDDRSPQTVSRQISRVARAGWDYALFAYNAFFERFGADGRPVVDQQSTRRTALRNALFPRLRRVASRGR